MLLHETTPFDDPDWIYELKLDGVRCLAYLDETGAELRNKRNKYVSDIYPELADIYKCAKRKCILDGELVCMADGKPDFFALQRRTLMGDRLKIAIAAMQNPVQFVAYDILYVGDTPVTDLPLMQRKRLLSENIAEGHGLSISRFIEKQGVAFFELAKQQDLEGIVAKRKDSKYHFDKRTRDWLKIKVMREEDLVICGYLPTEEGNVKDLALGYYDRGGKLCERGRVYFGMSRSVNEKILRFARTHTAARPEGFAEDDQVIWIEPKLVGAVKYMMETKNGGMRQPVFKGLRDDKIAEDCIINRSFN